MRTTLGVSQVLLVVGARDELFDFVHDSLVAAALVVVDLPDDLVLVEHARLLELVDEGEAEVAVVLEAVVGEDELEDFADARFFVDGDQHLDAVRHGEGELLELGVELELFGPEQDAAGADCGYVHEVGLGLDFNCGEELAGAEGELGNVNALLHELAEGIAGGLLDGLVEEGAGLLHVDLGEFEEVFGEP